MLAPPRVCTVPQSQIEPGYIPALPLISCVSLSKLLNLSSLVYSSQHGNNRTEYNVEDKDIEREYGKNIQWASKMNEISECAEYFITENESFALEYAFLIN